MSFYELDAPRENSFGSPFSRFGQSVLRGVRAMQYARMRQALSELSDDHLHEIGLTRGDIPEHAHKCVYGKKA